MFWVFFMFCQKIWSEGWNILADVTIRSERHLWHQQHEERLCRPKRRKTTKEKLWLVKACLYQWFIRFIVGCFASERQTNWQRHSKGDFCRFWFSLQTCSGHSSPFTRRPGLILKRYKTGYGCSLLPLNQFYLSLSLLLSLHDTTTCFITPRTCNCDHPLNGLRLFWGGKKKKKNGFFANQTWGHFCVWPSEPPMDFVDLLHPQNSWVCGDWTLKLWKTVLFCLVFFPLTERLLMCQRKGSTFVLCKSSHVFRFWDLLWRLTSVHSTSDKNGLTA